MKTIKIGIAEDQEMFREGLIKLLSGFRDIEVIMAHPNGQELLDAMEDNRPDVVLLDYRMPIMNGLHTSINISKRYPRTKILILSMYDDDEFVIKSLNNGAHGYLSKDDSPEEIERAILSVVDTGYYLNERTSKHLIKKLIMEGKMTPSFKEEEIQFSVQELQIIELICNEHTNQEIADIISRSKRTVEHARTSIMEKIGAKNVVGIVMYAVKNKLVSLETSE